MGNDSSKASKSSSGKTSGINSLGIKSGPSSATVQKHIENAKKSRILQMKGCGLKKFPDSLTELFEIIRNLDLNQNKIRVLPSTIGNFIQLRQLHLSENILACLPDEMGLLKKLEVLNLQSNSLSVLPDSLVGCASLKSVNLSFNTFREFPIVLCHLMELETLIIASNAITCLPNEITTLRASELNLNQNRLNSLNSQCLAKCARLKILRVEENCLGKTEFTLELLQESSLSIISCSGNLFQDKEFHDLPGYDAYQERLTATRRKM
uniref:Leucine-rich repeat-containing protein 57 n=1 Tax=Heterorhabditis bacteriophora TaxID=37862 RepID=A0A1I7XUL0_HETBA